MRRRTFLRSAGAGAVGLSAAACGSSGTPAGSPAGASASATSSAPKLSGKGPFTYASGKDATGFVPRMIAQWNAAHPDEKCTYISLSSSADSQRQSLVQNALAKSPTYGVLNVDVVWTAEFAANGWITELDKGAFPFDTYIPTTVTTGQYFGRQYTIPWLSGGGLLYYRKDLLEAAGVSAPPTTWAQMLSAWDKVKSKQPKINCYAGQFQKYEGLTCNFSEAVDSAGGTVLTSADKASVDTAEATKGLAFLADGFKQGYIPKAALTYLEEDGRNAFQAGNLLFLRNWTYMYALANATDGSSKVAGKFAVAPLPGLAGPGVSTLGGNNLAISTWCANKASALAFIQFMTAEKQQRQNLLTTAQAPPIASLYDEKAAIAKFPYLPTLKASIINGRKRPEAVNYNDVTTAIQNAAYSALQGTETPKAAMTQLQATLAAALAKK